MPDILRDLSDAALTRAIEANLSGYLYALAGSLALRDEVEFHDGADLLYSLTAIRDPLFNEVMRTRLAPDEADGRIAALLARARARDVPLFWWSGPAARPRDLDARLLRHGFTPISQMPGMAVDLHALNEETPVPAGFALERIRDEEALRRALEIIQVSFGFSPTAFQHWHRLLVKADFAQDPQQRHYLGRLEGQPVAASALIVHAGVAGIYNVATRWDARRRGIGTAMTLTPLREARQEGYRVGVLHSSPSGLSVYERLGFKTHCTIRLYLWTPPRRERLARRR